ncbi:hypothetical protein PS056_24565, partial [Shigella sonnei]|nr:hypothetical protein [Shigella sonnei]
GYGPKKKKRKKESRGREGEGEGERERERERKKEKERNVYSPTISGNREGIELTETQIPGRLHVRGPAI